MLVKKTGARAQGHPDGKKFAFRGWRHGRGRERGERGGETERKIHCLEGQLEQVSAATQQWGWAAREEMLVGALLMAATGCRISKEVVLEDVVLEDVVFMAAALIMEISIISHGCCNSYLRKLPIMDSELRKWVPDRTQNWDLSRCPRIDSWVWVANP